MRGSGHQIGGSAQDGGSAAWQGCPMAAIWLPDGPTQDSRGFGAVMAASKMMAIWCDEVRNWMPDQNWRWPHDPDPGHTRLQKPHRRFGLNALGPGLAQQFGRWPEAAHTQSRIAFLNRQQHVTLGLGTESHQPRTKVFPMNPPTIENLPSGWLQRCPDATCRCYRRW